MCTRLVMRRLERGYVIGIEPDWPADVRDARHGMTTVTLICGQIPAWHARTQSPDINHNRGCGRPCFEIVDSVRSAGKPGGRSGQFTTSSGVADCLDTQHNLQTHFKTRCGCRRALSAQPHLHSRGLPHLKRWDS